MQQPPLVFSQIFWAKGTASCCCMRVCAALFAPVLCGICVATAQRRWVIYGDKHHEITWMSIHPSPSRMKNGASKPQTVQANSCSVSNGCKRHGEEPVSHQRHPNRRKQTNNRTNNWCQTARLAKEQLTNATSLYVAHLLPTTACTQKHSRKRKGNFLSEIIRMRMMRRMTRPRMMRMMRMTITMTSL